ncbi:MAG: polysaccharide deacetylase family protein [Oscillospiraceae bacterium]
MYKIIKLKSRYLSIILFMIIVLTAVLGISSTIPVTATSSITDVQPDVKHKTVYLTFDDGPSKNTAELLEILDKYNVKATFFVIGKDENAKDLMWKIATKGHSIAPHCCRHEYNYIYSSFDNYMKDFNEIEHTIFEATGQKNKIFRFPGGSANYFVQPKLMQEIIDAMTNKGYVYYDWNIVSGDDTAIVYPAQTLFNNVVKQGENKDRLIILFHDTNLANTTPKAVEKVIQYYQSKGYIFSILEEQVKPIQFKKPSDYLKS